MATVPPNAVPKAKPSYYTQSQWNSLTREAKIAEVGYTVPKTVSAPRPSTTTSTPAPVKTTGVVVLSNRGSPVTDVQSGLQLQAGQGVVNVGGGTSGGGLSIPITVPTQTSAGVVSAPSGTALQGLAETINYGQSPIIQEGVRNLQQPTFKEVTGYETPANAIGSKADGGYIYAPEVKAPSVDLSSIPKYAIGSTPEGGYVFREPSPVEKLQDTFSVQNALQTAQTKQKQFVESYKQQGFNLSGVGYATASFGGGVIVGGLSTVDAVLNPVRTVKSVGALGYGLVTSPVETGGKIVSAVGTEIATNPFGFAGELFGSGLATGKIIKVAKIPFSKTSLVQTGTKEVALTKVSKTSQKLIPQIGEDIKFQKVVQGGNSLELSKPTYATGIGKVDASLRVAENKLVSLGTSKTTGKPFALLFQKTTGTEISASVVADGKIASSLYGKYTPELLTSLETPKVSYILQGKQTTPTTLRAIAKGTISDEGTAGIEFKGIVQTGTSNVKVFGGAKQITLPSPEPFASQGLQKFSTTSDALVLRGGSTKDFLKFPITAQEVVKAQSRKSVFGQSVSQEFMRVNVGERQASRFVDVSEVIQPKIGSRPKILEPSPKEIVRLPPATPEQTNLLLKQIQKTETATQEQVLRESLEKQLTSKGLLKGIGEKVKVRQETSLGTISVKSFKEVTTTPKGVSTIPFSYTKTTKSSKAFYDIQPTTKPSAPIVSTRQTQKPSSGFSISDRSQYPTISQQRIGINLEYKPSVSVQPSQIFSTNQLPSTNQIFKPSTQSGLGTSLQPLSGQNLFSGLQSGQQQQQIPQYKLQQLSQLSQIQQQRTTQRTSLIPKLKTPPRRPLVPKTPRIPFISLPKSSKFLGARQTSRRGKKFKAKKKYAIPFADYLSVTQTAIRTGGRATQPRITRKAGFEYLKAIQQGQVRFSTVEQRRNPKRYSGYDLGL